MKMILEQKTLLRTVAAALIVSPLATSSAFAGYLFTHSDVSGLSAEAEFTLLAPTVLEIRLKNTSTGLPGGFGNADQILTGVSWDFGHPGYNGDTMITGGSVVIGATSQSVDFDTGSYGPGFDVSGEWGYGNMDGTGALTNFVSANTAQGTDFGGPNLDGPASVDGPQGGLISSAYSIPLGGLGAIRDEVVATVDLSIAITDAELLGDLLANGVQVEYGSDAAFHELIYRPIPAPGALMLLGLGGLVGSRRRRH